MKRFVFGAFLGATLGATGLIPLSAAMAQEDGAAPPKEATTENTIVVTGERLPDKAVNRFIYDMIRPQAIGQDSQYPRLRDDFCPSVIGFPEEAANAITERMRRVARAAGIPVATGDCRANMHLVRVEDGPKAIRYLREKNARASFGIMPLWQRDLIERREGPVYSWQQTYPYGADSDAAAVSNLVNGGPLGEGALNFNFIYQNPRMRTPVTTAFRHSTVMVERAALEDVSPTQLADFAVMRGLVTAREDRFREGARTADSILNLFDPAVDPDERLPSLGRMDLALLTSLYAAPDDVNANRQRGRMVKTFKAVLEELE
ncbi:MAG: hypothetical protein WBA51_16465 [Erythrobacter sp.]